MDEKELFKNFSKVFEESKKRKINDFDSGLLQDSFKTVTGTPEQKYNEHRDHLVNIATRLENIYINNEGERPEILSKIDTFLEEGGLPKTNYNVSDFHGGGRVLDIQREDHEKSVCEQNNFEGIMKAIRDEQHSVLINKVKLLEYKAKARLKSEFFKWHTDDEIIEKDYAKKIEGDNGRTTE